MSNRVKLPAVLIIATLVLCRASSRAATRASGHTGQTEPPTDAASLTASGQAAFQGGRFDEAKRLLQAAVRLAPRSARAHALLGLTLARQGDVKNGLVHLRRAHQVDPADADYAYDFAVLSVQARQFAAAVPVLEALHRQSPQSDDVLVNLARAYAGAGESGKLATLVSALPAADYGNESLLKTLATALAAAHQTLAVEALWQAAIHHDPGQPLPYAALAGLWTARGEASRALNLLESAPPAARGPVYLYALGQARLALRNYREASKSFQEITRQMPGNEEARQQLIRSYLLANQLTSAEEAAEDAAKRFPGVADFPYQQAVADYMLGRNAAAMAALAPVILKAGEKGSRPLLLMAVLLSQSGKYQEATNYFARAEQLETGCNALASYFDGATLLRMHRPQDAALQLRAAVRCHPHFALAEYRLGQALSQSGKKQEALAVLQQSTRDDPTLAEPYYALAQIHRRLGDVEAAQQALAKFNSLHAHAATSDRDLLRSGWH
ncbi:MAG: tetratricopeptide repeat protein [Terriglobia bacterium]